MIDTLKNYRHQKKFEIYAFVVMPDHIHLLLTPAYDVSVEKVAQYVKGGFSFRLKRKGIWEDSYDDRRIKDLSAFETCKQYILSNPVRARITSSPEDYAYSSLRYPEMMDPTPEWLDEQRRG